MTGRIKHTQETVYWIWKSILKWDNQEHGEKSLKALYICICGRLFSIKEKLCVELRWERVWIRRFYQKEYLPACIVNLYPSNIVAMGLFHFYAAKRVLFQSQKKKDSSQE